MNPPGSIVGLYWDGRDKVKPGDVLETVTTGRRYEIVHVRIQERGKHVGRQHFKARVMAKDEPTDSDVGHHWIAWYSRG